MEVAKCVVFFNMQNANFSGALESERTRFALLQILAFYNF